MRAFYVGSCRYQSFFSNFFPPRLHTTSEILNFLRKYISGTITFSNNYEFGDAIHNDVIQQSNSFLKERPLTASCTKFYMEICSNKVGYIGDTIVSAYYAPIYGENIVVKHQTNDEIRNDILQIKELLATHFNIHNVYIITHISMPLRDGSYIEHREELVRYIRTLTDIITVIDVSAYMMTQFSSLEDVLPDSFHFSSNAYEKMHVFISKYLS